MNQRWSGRITASDLAIAGRGAGAGCAGVVDASPVATFLIRRITDTVAGLSGGDEDGKGDQEKLGKNGREAHTEGDSCFGDGGINANKRLLCVLLYFEMGAEDTQAMRIL